MANDILKERKPRCAFCGKSQDQVRRLVVGPNVYICDQCIELCREIISDDLDLGANGASDCLAVTGTLDLSNLSLALGDATALDETKIYTIATAPSFTGTFASVTLPNRKWRVSVADTKVKLVYANGTVLFFR